jgi:hypothetical protein
MGQNVAIEPFAEADDVLALAQLEPFDSRVARTRVRRFEHQVASALPRAPRQRRGCIGAMEEHRQVEPHAHVDLSALAPPRVRRGQFVDPQAVALFGARRRGAGGPRDPHRVARAGRDARDRRAGHDFGGRREPVGAVRLRPLEHAELQREDFASVVLQRDRRGLRRRGHVDRQRLDAQRGLGAGRCRGEKCGCGRDKHCKAHETLRFRMPR